MAEDNEEQPLSDEEWYKEYWKNASIGDPSYDNVRRPLPETRLWTAIKFWTLAGICLGSVKGCDYLASKINPFHPNHRVTIEEVYQYNTENKEREDFQRWFKSTRENR